MHNPTFFYASGAESLECLHAATMRRDQYRRDCLQCGASAFDPTEAGAAEVAEAVATIADWQAEWSDSWEADDHTTAAEPKSLPAPSLAEEVAQADGLLRRAVVDAQETTRLPVSGVLHGRVLLVLAERDDVRDAGLSLQDAAAWARVLAVVVERVRLGAAFFSEAVAA
ncbi:hypothetical protein LEP48_01325 [Isoptericola sp. NEAU-Y5]|uniref:Uncharacterized protein n=1 Tax=Isoptericola luteus TaxID=2879484 RepID=A0ABS7ZAA9_9MICO|nr:hypothetical protein [Isoptericola sp. NEAU-Y5]MCA5891991.1 hypothetical protein [Isoptericola sp. NEAU-Y5]